MRRFKEIIGAATPKWYTSNADRLMLPITDLRLTELLQMDDYDLSMLRNLWLGCLARGGNVAVRSKGAQKTPGIEWLILVSEFEGHCFLGWPAYEVKLGEGLFEKTALRLAESNRDLHFVFVLSVDEWEACCFEVASPLSLVLRRNWMPGCGRLITEPCIVLQGRPESLWRLAARNSFWNLPKTTLVQLAKAGFGLDLQSESLFNILWSLIQQVFQDLPENDRLAMLQRRCRDTPEQDCAEAIFGLDLTNDLLPTDDKTIVKKAKEAAQAQMKEVGELSKEVVKKKTSIAALGAGANKPKQKSEKQSKAEQLRKWRGLKECPAGSITQPEASGMCPPGGYIWRNRHGGAWCGHYPPHRRVSASWLAFGHRQAAMEVLAKLWASYLDDTGLGCPVSGLMPPPQPSGDDGEGAPANPGGVSSGSSSRLAAEPAAKRPRR